MRRSRPRTGFTLIEALAAISILALAGSVLMLAAQTSLDATDDGANQAIAQGICEQILDEIMSKRYVEKGESYNQNTLGPAADETTRQSFDDSDDFNGYQAMPAADAWGQILGAGDDSGGQRHANFRVPSAFFQNWRVKVEVYYVDGGDLSRRLDDPPVAAGGTLSTTSGYRGAEVTVECQDSDGSYRTLAKGRRVYAYIPPAT